MSSEITPLSADVKWEGKIVRAGVERSRYPDGTEVEREKVWHPGAVGILALDGDHLWLTRQPREAIGAAASLEIPAGKLDVPGESPLQTAQRELAEEIGKAAEHWDDLVGFYTSPGFSDEWVQLYVATGLSDAPGHDPDQDERIDIVPWPLARLDEAIEQCEDSKSLIALLWLAARRAGASGTGPALRS